MDIQFVLNSYGVAVYLTSYMMKSEGKIGKLLRDVNNEMRHKNMSVVQKMVQLASKFQNCTEVSAQKCVYHLLSMPVCMSTREHLFINTFRREDRFKPFKDVRFLMKMADDATNVYITSVHEKYIARPDDLDNVCLAEFVAAFNYVTKEELERRQKRLRLPKQPKDQDYLDDDAYYDDLDEFTEDLEAVENDPTTRKQQQQQQQQTSVKMYKLSGDLGYVERRKRLKIIRFRRYDKKRQTWDYYREQVLLFMPWRDEEREVEVDETFEVDETLEVYEMHKKVVVTNMLMFENLLRNETEAEALQRIERELEEQRDEELVNHVAKQIQIDDILMERVHSHCWSGSPEHSLDSVLEELEDKLARFMEALEEHTGYHSENENLIQGRTRVDQPLPSEAVTKARRRMQDDAYRQFMRTLNRGQFTFLINCLNKIERRTL